MISQTDPNRYYLGLIACTVQMARYFCYLIHYDNEPILYAEIP
jgi:hypothetical protein